MVRIQAFCLTRVLVQTQVLDNYMLENITFEKELYNFTYIKDPPQRTLVTTKLQEKLSVLQKEAVFARIRIRNR